MNEEDHIISILSFSIEAYDQVYALWQRCTGVGLSGSDSLQNIASYLERNPSMSFVASNDKRLVGAILCGHDGRRGYIHHLAVDEEFRRCGIGRRLVEHALAALRGEGIQKCHLFIFHKNEPGITFWQKIGWTFRQDIRVMSTQNAIKAPWPKRHLDRKESIMMDAQEIIQAESEYVLQTYVRPEIVFSHGDGAYLYDTNGKQYLDFTSGIAVTALGHSDPQWVAAVSDQAGKLVHVSNLYHSAPQAELARRLVDSSFADKVYFCNSGAEANEAALKFARKAAQQITPQKSHIVAFSGGFHGRTMGALATTYKAKYREPFAPLMPGVFFAAYNDLDAAAKAISDDTCAVIVEPLQGEGGVNPATPEFLQELRHLCDQHQALLIFDEVQCGLGRTGTLWAHEAYKVTPDIMTLAKPLAGGLPIGATLLTQAVADVIKPGDHGSTFAAGPLVCRAAEVVFDRVSQPYFLAQVRENGNYLRHRLLTLEQEEIVEVRGAGYLVGVEMKSAVAPLIATAREKGLLVINAGENVLRLAPPLIAGRVEIDQAVNIIDESLSAQASKA